MTIALMVLAVLLWCWLLLLVLVLLGAVIAYRTVQKKRRK